MSDRSSMSFRIVAGLIASAMCAAATSHAQTIGPTQSIDHDGDPFARAERIEACLRDSGSASPEALRLCGRQTTCPKTAVASRPIQLNWRDGEAHPAWTTNDRARLTDLGSARLAELLERHTGTHRVNSDAQAAMMTVETRFSGTDSAHREVGDWVKMPREVTLTLRLQRAGTSEVIGEHTVQARMPIGIRLYQRETSSATWLQRSLDELQRGASNLLDTYACEPVVFPFIKTPKGRLSLDLRGLRQVQPGLRVLLVPTTGVASAEPYAVARITHVESGLYAQLDAISGDLNGCTNGDCVAVAL